MFTLGLLVLCPLSTLSLYFYTDRHPCFVDFIGYKKNVGLTNRVTREPRNRASQITIKITVTPNCVIKRLSMDVHWTSILSIGRQLDIHLHCVQWTQWAQWTHCVHWTGLTRNGQLTSWSAVSGSIGHIKMDPMDVHCVHWTCPFWMDTMCPLDTNGHDGQFIMMSNGPTHCTSTC